jgi:uncharacterized membrane protein YgcG
VAEFDTVLEFVFNHLFFIVMAGIALFVIVRVRFAGRQQGRNEALFVSMFPELQPYYHPARVFEYVKARLAQAPPRGGKMWKDPPGFTGRTADIRFEGEREVVRILDAAGALLTQFIFENHKEGGAIRVGKGKLTASTRMAQPRVRYWHPDREFKWTPATWVFKTPVADRPFESSDRSSFSSDSSSSSSTSSRVASAAPFVAAGGAFDGGGASQSWSEGGSATAEAGSASTSY